MYVYTPPQGHHTPPIPWGGVGTRDTGPYMLLYIYMCILYIYICVYYILYICILYIYMYIYIYCIYIYIRIMIYPYNYAHSVIFYPHCGWFCTLLEQTHPASLAEQHRCHPQHLRRLPSWSVSYLRRRPESFDHGKGGGLGFCWKKNMIFQITNQKLSFKGRVPTPCLRISSESCSKLSTNIVLGSLGLFRSGRSHLPLMSSWFVIHNHSTLTDFQMIITLLFFNHPKPSDSPKDLEPPHKKRPNPKKKQAITSPSSVLGIAAAGDVLHSHVSQVLHLARAAGSGKNGGANALGELHCDQTDTASGCVDQHALALPWDRGKMGCRSGKDYWAHDSLVEWYCI